MEVYAIIIVIVLIIIIINLNAIEFFMIGFLDGLNIKNNQIKKDLIEDFRIFYNIEIIFSSEYRKKYFVDKLENRYKIKNIDRCEENSVLLSYSSDILFILMSYTKLNILKKRYGIVKFILFNEN